MRAEATAEARSIGEGRRVKNSQSSDNYLKRAQILAAQHWEAQLEAKAGAIETKKRAGAKAEAGAAARLA